MIVWAGESLFQILVLVLDGTTTWCWAGKGPPGAVPATVPPQTDTDLLPRTELD